MKIDWNKRYTTIAVYSFIVICCSIVFYSIMDEMSAFTEKIGWILEILQPFIIGFVIAYLLNFILIFFEEKVLVFDSIKNINKKGKRVISILLTYITAFTILYLFVQFILPQLIYSIMGLVNDIPAYVTNVTKLVNELTANIDANNEYLGLAINKWKEFVNYTIEVITNLVPILGNVLKSIASSIWNILLGLIISIYLLIDKENFCALNKKITYALLSKKHAEIVIKLAHRSNETFGHFISGKIVNVFMIGCLTFVVLTIFKMPYATLIAVIIGVSNIIPFFGPIFGAIPSFIIILFVSPIQALWFAVIMLVIQQIDSNIIGPKILGESIGIAPFWILFSVLVAEQTFGFIGMIVGVPTFAIIYSVVKEIVEAKLGKKGLPRETDEYR